MAYHFNNRIEILGMESMINDDGKNHTLTIFENRNEM